MRLVVHAPHAAIESDERGGISVDCHILRQLVIGALKESSRLGHNGLESAFGQSRGHSGGLFLGNADIDKAVTRLGAACGHETDGAGHAGRDGHDLGVGLHPREYMLCEYVGVVIGIVSHRWRPRCGVERAAVMEALLLLLGHRQPVALAGVEVDHYGAIGILHHPEGGYEFAEVISVVNV